MKHRFWQVATAAILTTQACAGTMASAAVSKEWNWVGSVALGPVWARAGETQTFFLAPEIEKTWVAQKSSKAIASGELFLGVQKTLSPEWLLQAGIVGAATGNASLQGLIWDDGDPQFENYRYTYSVRSSRLGIKGKLILDKNYPVMPWISASVGAGFNQAHRYKDTPLIFEALPNPAFTDRTQTAFAYTLGAGIQKSFYQNWQAGIGYEFADWGKSALGRAPEQTLNSGLSLQHLYTNGFMVNIAYVA
ncbi:porin family protein [Legionella geestiana]|uniref:outer membrane protein n=1 Tax=Legionella geestiana TaxID=45065 RepID=UPI0010920753|nr:porin family protein [Legionella geestiana]QDQ40944.1 porin family protein [Legionella geestiana]